MYGYIVGFIVEYKDGRIDKVIETNLIKVEEINEYLLGDGDKAIVKDLPGYVGQPFLLLNHFYPHEDSISHTIAFKLV